MKLVEITKRKFGKTYVTKVAYIYSVKKNGERYANPSMEVAQFGETTQEQVLARIQRLNPQSKFQLAGIEVYNPAIKLQH